MPPRPHVATAELLSQLDTMQPRVAAAVWRVLRLRSAVLTAKVMMDTPRFRRWEAGAETANVAVNSIMHCFALELSYLFEENTSSETTKEPDASIPILSNILGNEGVRSALIDRSRGWLSQWIGSADDADAPEIVSEHSIDAALATSHRIWIEPLLSNLAKLRDFRDRRHSEGQLHEQNTALPDFEDLCKLADLAGTFVLHSSSAIEGRARNLLELEDAKRESDRDFWSQALAPLMSPEP